MDSAKVASVRIRARTKEDVLAQVAKAMELAHWQEYVKGKKIFIKPNCVSDRVVPGQCTSPWVVEGVVKMLREHTDAELFLGDSDVATTRQFDCMIPAWGYDAICRKYDVKVINLSKQKIVMVQAGGQIFKKIPVPEILTKVDCIVSIPVLKTHVVTKMTGALKNQWGCLTRVRHQYHLNADQCIAEINKFLKVTFVVADATVCMEGMGPCVGIPKVMNYVFATNDRVALDTLACELMKIDVATVGQISWGKKLGIGTDMYEIVGDKIKPQKFIPAKMGKHPIVRVEMKLRKVPVLNYILFRTPLFKIPAWMASKYTGSWYYYRSGKKYARDLVKRDDLYSKEFKELIK
jgi:uncharacterized protein (DUF362 family)